MAGSDPFEVLEVAHRVHGLVRRQIVGIGGTSSWCLAGMHLDQLATSEDAHQGAVGTDVDPGTDQVAGHRIQRLGDFDVMIPMDLRRGVDRQVVTLRRCRQQPRLLLDGEHFGGPALGGAMHPLSGPLPTPRLGPPLGVGEINERLTGEERRTHERHGPLDTWLVLWATHPGRVDPEASRLGVLDERLVQPWLQRIGVIDDGGQVVRDHRGEDAAEERPRRLAPVDHVLGGLPERQPHEAVPRVAGGEDQRLHDTTPAGLGVDEEAHPAEIDLQLIARLPIGDPHRRASAAAAAAHLQHVALHRAQRHHHTTAFQQLVDLHPRQVGIDPRLDLLVIGGQQPPRLAVTVAAVRTHRLHHQPDEDVGQLLDADRHGPAPTPSAARRSDAPSCGQPVTAARSIATLRRPATAGALLEPRTHGPPGMPWPPL